MAHGVVANFQRSKPARPAVNSDKCTDQPATMMPFCNTEHDV